MCQKYSTGSRQWGFFGMLGHKRGEAEAAGTRREIWGAAVAASPGVSAHQRAAALPQPLLLVRPSPEGLFISACVSLPRGKREEGKGRSRMPRLCSSRRIVRDTGVAEYPLSSGTCLQPSSTSAIREVASPELLLRVSRAGRREGFGSSGG